MEENEKKPVDNAEVFKEQKPEPKKQEDQKAIISFVCGIISIVLAFVSYFIFGFLSFPALVLGIIAIVYSAKLFKTSKFGLVGFITGILGTILSSIAVILYIFTLILLATAIAA